MKNRTAPSIWWVIFVLSTTAGVELWSHSRLPLGGSEWESVSWLSLSFCVANNPWCSLAYRLIIPISVSIFSCRYPLASKFPSFLRTPFIEFRTHSNLIRPYLDYICKNSYFQIRPHSQVSEGHEFKGTLFNPVYRDLVNTERDHILGMHWWQPTERQRRLGWQMYCFMFMLSHSTW